jgi:ABC-type multidrug transport system permease subunit
VSVASNINGSGVDLVDPADFLRPCVREVIGRRAMNFFSELDWKSIGVGAIIAAFIVSLQIFVCRRCVIKLSGSSLK